MNGQDYVFDQNLQGDIIRIYDENFSSVVKYTYDAWGKILSIDGTGASTIGEYNSLRYRGYYYDSDTGLYYLNSRYYDPVMCRFVNADGYASTGQGIKGNNMYAYCQYNPIMLIDQGGICPEGFLGPCPGLNCPYFSTDDAFTQAGHNCYRDGCMGTVIIAEEGTGNGGRLNAKITVTNSGGQQRAFTGSTLPDNPGETYRGLDVATLLEGEYKITQIQNGYLNKPAYYVRDMNVDNTDKVPVTRLYGTPNAYWDTGTAIYIHKGSNNSPGSGKRWSVGCILIDSTQIDDFAHMVGSEGVLIIRR